LDIFLGDDDIIKNMGANCDFPKSSEKRLVAWMLHHQDYFGEDV